MDTFSSDTTLSTLNVAAGRVAKVANNAVLTVSGDTQIDGTLEADSGRIAIRFDGSVTINGTIRAADPDVAAGGGSAAARFAGIVVQDRGEM